MITTVFEEIIDEKCLGCALATGNYFKEGMIYKSSLFSVMIDAELAWPAMLVIAPTRHVSFYVDFTDEEKKEWELLTNKCRQAVKELWNQQDVFFCWYEKPGKHIHMVVTPIWSGFEREQSAYGIVAELIEKNGTLKNNTENMMKVKTYAKMLKDWFSKNIK